MVDARGGKGRLAGAAASAQTPPCADATLASTAIAPGRTWAAATGLPQRRRARGGGWHRGQLKELRLMNFSRTIIVPQRAHGRSAWP